MFGFGRERLRDAVLEILALERAAERPPVVTVDGQAMTGVASAVVTTDALGNPEEIEIETDGRWSAGGRSRRSPAASHGILAMGDSTVDGHLFGWTDLQGRQHVALTDTAYENPVWNTLIETYRAKRALPDTDDTTPAYRVERVTGGFEVHKSSRHQRRDVSVGYRLRDMQFAMKVSDLPPTPTTATAILAELQLPSLYETQWEDVGDRTFKTLDKAERWLQQYVADAQTTHYDPNGVCLGDSNE